jgi:hypothetical protein
MRSRFIIPAVLAIQIVFFGAIPTASGTESPIPAISDYVSQEKLIKINGFLPLYRDVAGGALYIEIPKNGGPDLLYQSVLTSGFGSRDVGSSAVDTLDRGRFGNGGLVSFRRFGKRVLLIERNTTYYTPSSSLDSPDDAGLSFPNSVLAGFNIVAEDDESLLIDTTNFFLQDGVDIPSVLKTTGQGDYTFTKERSVVDISHVHGSERSIEVDALLTFSSSNAPSDSILGRIAADRSAVLVHERISFIRLPDLATSNFRPRIFDARSGFFDNSYYDPALLPYHSTRRSFIAKHALVKKNPAEEVSEPETPIIFYIDPAVPADLHPLIREAALWWNPAFEAAGFKNAIQVQDLPPDVDPFDAGINIILWVPRETRGYSVGGVIWDPRTGQILKAIVRLDAMRIQADRLLLDALTSPYVDHPDFAARDETLRQRFCLLVAHEIGHTLGLAHQFIASAQGMSSVMDYPFPNLPLDSKGVPVLHDTFPQAVGAWDKAAIFYGYHPFLPSEEAESLRSLVEATERTGLYWMTDQDTADANPLVQKWDRGTDPVAELEKVLVLRHAALARFSKYVIPSDEPLSVLQDALAPLYLLHQFEVKAVASMLGGYTYRYAMRDEEHPIAVPGPKQREALKALLSTIEVATLGLDQQMLELMSPRPPSYPATPESFSGDTGQIFDALRPVEDATALTMNEILEPRRAARLAQAKARDPEALGLDEVLTEVVAHTWKLPAQKGSAGAVQRAIALTVMRSILLSATSKTAPMVVRGACWAALDDIVKWADSHPLPDWKDVYAFAKHAIGAGAFEMPKGHALVLDPMGDFD